MTHAADNWQAELAQRAEQAGIEFSPVSADGDQMSLNLPSTSHGHRVLRVSDDNAADVLGSNFESWTYLGDYAAVYDRASGLIEVDVSGAGQLNGPRELMTLLDRFGTLPDKRPVEQVEKDDESDEGDPVWQEVRAQDGRIPTYRATTVVAGLMSFEISPATLAIRAIEYMGAFWNKSKPTLKVEPPGLVGIDHMVKVLEEYTTSLFFELSVAYGVNLVLKRSRNAGVTRTKDRAPRVNAARSTTPPPSPAQAYPEEACALYAYATSARGMPLLEYLAYYQVLEYFFPAYAHADAIRKVRNSFLDPGFNPHSDIDVGRLVRLAGGGSRGGLTEREQLKATLRQCVSEESLRELVVANDAVAKVLRDRKTIDNVPPVNLNDKNQSLTDQIASRVYAIRCRIVHTKDSPDVADSGGSAMLLPLSEEADRLRSDISIVEYLAQRAIIAAAKPAAWQRRRWAK